MSMVRKGVHRAAKDKAVAQARAHVRREYPTVAPEGACLFLAYAIRDVMAAGGYPLIVQAGSAFWPRMTRANDDGFSPNVFGYQFDWAQAAGAIARDVLPEMHVWCWDPSEKSLVDLASGAFPVQCRKLIGADWRAPRPPSYLWHSPSTLPPDASYVANPRAIQVAEYFYRRANQTP